MRTIRAVTPYMTVNPTKLEIAARLRMLAAEMDDVAAQMDYFGGFAEWSEHSRDMAGAAVVIRIWAAEISKEETE